MNSSLVRLGLADPRSPEPPPTATLGVECVRGEGNTVAKAFSLAQDRQDEMSHNGKASYPVATQSPSALPSLPEPHTVTPSSMRDVMSQFATGVIVLTVGGENIHGMTANAFTSVSLRPPLVLCCVARTAVMHKAITCARRFAVSIMRADQEDLARYFADKSRPLGPAQFYELDWLPGPRTRAPLLFGSLAWLECELTGSYESGDHSIFLGTVLSLSRSSEQGGLLFFDGKYSQVAPR